MHRFKASKYKNSVAKCAKKEESITDILVETPLSSSNHVKVGAKFIACNIGSAGGGKVGIFGVNEVGRKGQHPTLAAHGDCVTDFEFSPFYHNLLLTASEDSTVKVWKLPSDGLSSGPVINPTCTFTGFQRKPELLHHHPVADNICIVANGNNVQIWNINEETAVFDCSSGDDNVQSVSWSADGKTFSCTTKGKALKVIDPRTQHVVQETKAHGNHKDSRVLMLGHTGKIITTGYSTSRSRELKAWDPRNLNSCIQTMEFGSSTGVLMPFFDPDTNLLFISAKGDSSLAILEVTDGSTCISQASQSVLPDQTKGMGISPKLCVDVMACEVDRLVQLCARQIVPVKIEVPRRSRTEYASELYPDTDSDEVVLTAEDWFAGKDGKRLKTSLNPAKRKPLQSDEDLPPQQTTQTPAKLQSKGGDAEVRPKPAQAKPAPVKSEAAKSNTEEVATSRPAARPFTGVRQCKFRHWVGTILHPTTHITNIPQISNAIPGGCDGFHVNDDYAAVPLSTPGGQVAVLELSKVGRVNTDLPCFHNVSAVSDLKWNPFYNNQLAVGLDDGTVKIWEVPESGLKETMSEPREVLSGHYSKILCMQYHPLACNLLATAGFDMNLIIWNLENGEMAIQLSGHEDEILSVSWSTDGRFLATVSKDKKIRIYDPRKSTSPVQDGPGPEGSRGARISWACEDKMIIVSGFSRQGQRTISVHKVDDLKSGPKASHDIDNSPSILISFYDEDSSVVFLSGKGDRRMISFEVSSEDPYLDQLAAFKSDQLHQGFSFLSKTKCDARKVEFARAWRLSKTSLEPISFSVPRVKMEYFQDDLFPDTRESGVASMTADGWLAGENKQPRRVSMRPTDMKPLSEAPKEAPKQRKYESYNASTYKTDEEKKEELLSAMSNKLDLDKGLEQDTMEGVDEDEWDDY